MDNIFLLSLCIEFFWNLFYYDFGLYEYYEIMHILAVLSSSEIFNGILINTLSAAIIFLLLSYIFRKPKFSMYSYTRNGDVYIAINNKKKFMNFNPDEVFVFLWIPLEIFNDRPAHKEQSLEAWKDSKIYTDWDKLIRKSHDGVEYVLYRSWCSNTIFPDRSADLYRFINVSVIKDYKFYYKINTKHGSFPKGNSDDMVMNFEMPSFRTEIS